MYPDRQQLLESIRLHSGRQMNRAFFLRIYGYELSFPGFADEAIKALNDAGCSKAREYYNATVKEYQRKQDEELKPVVKELHRKWENEWKRLEKEGEGRRREWEVKQYLSKKSDQELLNLLQMLY